jgi:hypothetical protein
MHTDMYFEVSLSGTKQIFMHTDKLASRVSSLVKLQSVGTDTVTLLKIISFQFLQI